MLPVLNDDILILVLSRVSIRTVLSASQANRRFHTLCYNRQVWLSLVADLFACGFLDWIPGQKPLDQLPLSGLLDLVKRARNGPRTWSGQHPTNPVVKTKIELHPHIPLGMGILDWENEARLLRGGRYLLFNPRGGRLQCWDVKTDRPVWVLERPPDFGSYWTLNFYGELQGNQIMILVNLRTLPPNNEKRTNWIFVIQIDIQTGKSIERFRNIFPQTTHDRPVHQLDICGDLAYVHSDSIIILIYWTLGRWLFLWPKKARPCEHPYGPIAASIIPFGYFIISYMTDEDSFTIKVYEADSLSHLLSSKSCPVLNDSVVHEVDELPSVVSFTTNTTKDSSPMRMHLSAHQNPLEDSRHSIYLYLNSNAEAVIHCLDLVVPTGNDQPCFSSHRIRSARSHLFPFNQRISSAGFTYFWDHTTRQSLVVDLLSNTSQLNEGQVVEVDQYSSDYCDLTAYSGALVLPTSSHVGVVYYE